MPPVEIAGLQPNNEAPCRVPLIKRHEVALKLIALLPGSRENGLLHLMGPYRIPRTSYSAVPAIKDTISCVVELSQQTFKCM